MFQDVRYGLRIMLQNKSWTTMVVLSLVLGIGANTALFSAIDAAFLRKLPAKNPDELVYFNWVAGRQVPMRSHSGTTNRLPDSALTQGSSFSY
jgi:hypothetical protein